jgi:hypothetical protein
MSCHGLVFAGGTAAATRYARAVTRRQAARKADP